MQSLPPKVIRLIKKVYAFVEPEGSSTCLQKFADGSCTESSEIVHTFISYFFIILPTMS